ncbi:MAG: hypothetical protein JKX76_02955 [Colwellia sp.]|nr:hypothetical protein [Colwellia sp.]
MKKILKERFDIQVTAPDETFSNPEFEVDKNASKIIGIQITSDRDDLLFYRGSQRLKINDNEILPEGFESKLLMTGLNVPPNTRMYDLGELDPGNGMVEVRYKDSKHSKMPFEPYRVSFYVFSKVDQNDN